MDYYPSIQPGYYLNAQSLSLTFSSDVDVVALNLNDTPPAISKYIAYDTLTPPNPFIAVTQDGKGPVVYDGGFPKFYNSMAPAVGTTYANLSAAHKYFVNAVNWVANPNINTAKKKILILGDQVSGGSYWVKGTATTDFSTSLARIAAAGNFNIVVKDSSDYGGVLNPTLAELSQYNAVVLFSTYWGPVSSLISNNAINDIVSFRENYGGIIIITDHGPVLNDLNSAISNNIGFFATANKLATRFGAWFSGNYDRTPVNVGFLRTTYGDHQLYANMANTDNIYAAQSESRVLVSQPTLYTASSTPTLSISSPGANTINLLMRGKDGSVLAVRLVYMIQSGDFLFFVDSNGATITNDVSDKFADTTFKLKIDTSNLGTVRGNILQNGNKVGAFEAVNNVVTMMFANGTTGKDCYNGDVFTAHVYQPFGYDKNITVVRPALSNPNTVKKTAIAKILRAGLGVGNIAVSKLKKLLSTKISSIEANRVEITKTLHQMSGVSNQYSSLPDITVEIYETKAQATSFMASRSPTPTDFVFVVENNEAYGYDSSIWKKLTETPIQILGRRKLLATSNTWRPTAISCYFDNSGKLIKL